MTNDQVAFLLSTQYKTAFASYITAAICNATDYYEENPDAIVDAFMTLLNIPEANNALSTILDSDVSLFLEEAIEDLQSEIEDDDDDSDMDETPFIEDDREYNATSRL